MDEMREVIDKCDREIVRLLNERAQAAREIGRIKKKAKQSVFAPDREMAVYEKVSALNQGPLPERSLFAVYREIMSGCIALEAPTRVSYLGPPGTFSHEAALQKFGASMEYLPAPEIRDVFLAITRGHAEYGIVPIENSTEGSVNATSDMLMETDLKICAEIFLKIHQNLLYNGELLRIKLVVSHPSALAQCRSWLTANLPGVPVREVASTALAAERAAREAGVAAVASEAIATLHSFNRIERVIEDEPNNTTRFIVLAKTFAGPTSDDRTSLLFSVTHKAGSLYQALEAFKANGINLTRIESRPSKKTKWEYCFFVDIEGHVEDPAVAHTLAELKPAIDELTVLGSYPRTAKWVHAPPADAAPQ